MANLSPQAKDLLELYKNAADEFYQQITLISSEGLTVMANKTVLAVSSTFLCNILIQNPEATIIHLPDVNYDNLSKVVLLMHTGEIPIDAMVMGELISICNLLKIKGTINCVGSFNCIDLEHPTSSNIVTDIHSDSIQIINQQFLTEGDVKEVTEEHFKIINTSSEPISTEFELYTIDDLQNEGDEDTVLPEESFDEEMEETPTKKTQNSFTKSFSDAVNTEAFQDALEIVIANKLTFRQAAEKFQVSKTLLWRHAKRLGYKKGILPKNTDRLDAMESLKNGETLQTVSKKYNIPISTLHRDKLTLFKNGNLPANVNLNLRKRGMDFEERLKKAIESIKNGKSQNEASKLYDIPKTTIWRKMKKINVSVCNEDDPDDHETSKTDANIAEKSVIADVEKPQPSKTYGKRSKK